MYYLMMGLIMKSFKGVVILDAGHGVDTPGKRSPVWSDGSQLFEWEFNRRVCDLLAVLLKQDNIDVEFTHLPTKDTSLTLRVKKANKIFASNRHSFLVSIHANAGGGTGWECFTSPGITDSDTLASYFCYEADKAWSSKWTMRFDESDGDKDKEANFSILTGTHCPSVLTENFFMDTERDCKYIMSTRGVIDVAEVHYKAIIGYIEDKYK